MILLILNRLLIVIVLAICIDYSSTLALTVINIGFFFSPAAFFFAITGQWKRALTVAASVTLTLYLFERIKKHYYKEPISASDFLVVFDTGAWEILLHYPLAGLGIALILFMVVASLLSHRMEARKGLIWRVPAFVTAILIALVILLYSKNSLAKNKWTESLPWGQGPFANLIFSGQSFRYAPPEVIASDTLFQERGSKIKINTERTASRPPDIVVWLQESTVNPVLYDLPNARLPLLKMFEPNPDTKGSGWLRVHTFGGRTWLSEFSFFSGLASSDFGSAAGSVYYTVTPHLRTSLAKVLKTHSYHTVILTPSAKTNYHALSAYRDFGIDEVVQPQDMGYPANPTRSLWDMESSELAEYAKKILSRPSEKPVFLYMLTLKEHGPYSSDNPAAYGMERAILNESLAGQMSDYLDRIEKLSEATEAFSTFIIQRKKPTLFLYFGDHQPKFGDNTLQYKTQFPHPDYLTQFVLRDHLSENTNIETTSTLTDLSFIGGLLLEQARLKPDPFFTANIQMRKLCQGRLQDCPDRPLVESYKRYIYHTLKTAGE